MGVCMKLGSFRSEVVKRNVTTGVNDASECPGTELDLHQFYTGMSEKGFAILPNVLNSAELTALLKALDICAERERSEGAAWFSHGNQRVFNLVNKGPEFLSLIDHPRALPLVERWIGPHALLSSLTANVALPTNGLQPLHSDQGHLPEPWLRCEAMNLIWVLDEFTKENGATRIVPGSHRVGSGPPVDAPPTTVVEAKSGSIICLDGRVWHSAGQNISHNTVRRALFAFYCRPYLRPQENFARSLDPSIRRCLTARRRALLGFDIWLGLGAVNGLPVAWMDGRERIGPTNADAAFLESDS
jgi:ectoine hydroxylase-related dioxygenase (phytanoyl-CoA dioxygenase family)